MQNPFLKDNFLLPTASLNKLKIVDLGEFAIDLISGEFFNKRLDSFFDGLGIKAFHEDKYNRFMSYFMAEDETVQKPAERIIEEIGENLGYILLTLKRGNASDRAAREDWTGEHWDYWNSIENVVLSGGLTYSCIGVKLREAAEALFERQGSYPYRLSIAADSEYLPLIGAYQRGTLEGGHIIMLDFGHTYVKRGYAVNGVLHILDKIESTVQWMADEPEQEKPELLNNFIVGVLLDTCQRMEHRALGVKPDVLAISIANYVYKGEIYYHRGEYGRLKLIADNYEQYLNNILSERLGYRVKVLLLHDGSAAAYGVDDDKAAVITLGTGLGVGFCDMSAWSYKKYTIL